MLGPAFGPRTLKLGFKLLNDLNGTVLSQEGSISLMFTSRLMTSCNGFNALLVCGVLNRNQQLSVRVDCLTLNRSFLRMAKTIEVMRWAISIRTSNSLSRSRSINCSLATEKEVCQVNRGPSCVTGEVLETVYQRRKVQTHSSRRTSSFKQVCRYGVSGLLVCRVVVFPEPTTTQANVPVA